MIFVGVSLQGPLSNPRHPGPVAPSVYEMAALTQDLDTQVITTKIKEVLLANNIGQKVTVCVCVCVRGWRDGWLGECLLVCLCVHLFVTRVPLASPAAVRRGGAGSVTGLRV